MTEDICREPDKERIDSVPQECYCPIDGIIDTLSRKYAIQVVCVINVLQPVRFGEIEEVFGGVSSSTLSSRLDELCKSELISRQQYDEIPPRVEYELTADGEELGELLKPILYWVKSRDPPE